MRNSDDGHALSTLPDTSTNPTTIQLNAKMLTVVRVLRE
jgi:hypothetical protein